MQKLTIYFGDLTHDTVGIATEVFPLNVAFIAAYAMKRFERQVEISIFKYIHQIEEAIEKAPPDILALSNYPWCHRVGMSLFAQLAERRPGALRIMGGPNFPHDTPSQQAFLVARPLIDGYVYLDGEEGFANLLARALEVGSTSEVRRQMRAFPVRGVASLDESGRLSTPPESLRLGELDEIPSPYLSGLLDPFFDGRLSPMIQTNRGCPFKCTFCHDGSDKVKIVNAFSIDRVKAEIRYISERVPTNTRTMFISDLNFGMNKRDSEICDAIVESMDRTGYPAFIDTTTGKNSKQRIIRVVEKLRGALGMSMSVQSMTDSVLKNVKRDNIRASDFTGLQPAIRHAKMPTYSETILGLPGETLASHFDTLRILVNAQMDQVAAYTLMLVNGSELATPAQRALWGLKTKYRVIPRDFTKMRSGEFVVETEEVVVETDTLPFDDYLKCRRMALLLAIVNHLGFRPLLRLIVQAELDAMGIAESLLDSIDGRTASHVGPGLFRLFEDFNGDSRVELWDSEEEIIAFFAKTENFAGLVDGQYGANLLQTYKARAFAEILPEIIDAVFHHAAEAFRSKSPDRIAELCDVERYCRGRMSNILGRDRMLTIPEAEIGHDFESWLVDPDDRPLSAFAYLNPQRKIFVLTRAQYDMVEDGLRLYGDTPLGRGKLMIRISAATLWRNSIDPGAFDPPTLDSGTLPIYHRIPESRWHFE
jgi:radical SAM superfamily enzyme YgiQ (UPF0313 family)